MEKVQLFTRDVNEAKKLQDVVNQWLEENKGKIIVTSRSMSCGAVSMALPVIVIAIFYREK